MKHVDQSKRIAAERLRVALDLFEAGVDIMRQTLRRRHPDASDEKVEMMLRNWISDRPGAECGDAIGEPGTWPRKSR